MQLREILDRNQLYPVFQPILDLAHNTFLGYEGLIRGPNGIPPAALLACARQQGLLIALEQSCLFTLLKEFIVLNLPGKLFVNITSAEVIQNLEQSLIAFLGQIQFPAAKIVLELTEHNNLDKATIETLYRLRQLGFSIALDDLGEGFSNLKVWSLLRPDYVKIDRHFIHELANDALKYEFVHAISCLAKAISCAVIAEGVENLEDLSALCRLDIGYAQGFLIAHPSPNPTIALPPFIADHLANKPLLVQPFHPLTGYPETLAKLVEFIQPITENTPNSQVLARFEANDRLHMLPVVSQEHTPIGLIWRYRFIDSFVRPYRRELYGLKPCTLFMDPQPTILEVDTPIHEASLHLSNTCQDGSGFGLIVTREGKYLGVCHGSRLLAKITEMQIEAARYANPLTQLPGNVPIYTHLQKCLATGKPFVTCYVDIDHFKPFNDVYGYHQGDRLICALAQQLLTISVRNLDFVGHIGGDDFVVVFQSSDWQERIRRLFLLFEQSLSELLSPEHLRNKGYYGESRTGELIFHSLPSLSVGAVVVAFPGQYHSYQMLADAASGAKSMAKRQPGSSLFVERRAPATLTPSN